MTHNVKQNEFLKITLLKYQQHEYSVLDIIQSACHLMGGIHSQPPGDDKERAFLDLNKVILLQVDPALMSIHSICSVSLKALEPLEEKLK